MCPDQFIAEAESMHKLTHPKIVQLLGVPAFSYSEICLSTPIYLPAYCSQCVCRRMHQGRSCRRGLAHLHHHRAHANRLAARLPQAPDALNARLLAANRLSRAGGGRHGISRGTQLYSSKPARRERPHRRQARGKGGRLRAHARHRGAESWWQNRDCRADRYGLRSI